MESPVVVDKPPEYHGSEDRGFPFEEEEGGGAWSELAARHPDIAARLRQPHPSAAWARKRRPSAHGEHDFGDFDRFIPSEFREHFPSSFNRRFGGREEQQQGHTCQPPQSPPQSSTSTATTATQTEQDHPPERTLPQYGLRNTVDLGQKSEAVDAEDRGQRSVSAPPESHHNMSAPQDTPEQPSQPRKVRNIPIFVEGRDAPVINDTLDHGSHFAEPKPAYVPSQSPPRERETYFPDESVHFNHPANFPRSFGAPFNKQYRQGQPFAQQKAYPQSASFARGGSPHRSQSPKPQHDEYVNVPVHHEKPHAKPEPPRPHQRHQQQQQPPQQQQHHPQQQQHHPQQQHQHQHQQQQQPPPKQQTPPPPPPPQQPKPHDPISQILEIQTNVLNLMSEVENFTGTKKDKRYIFLDEMLTRNLISLDNIETEGKENIRNARKEAIRCIQKCIAVLEAKAEGKSLSTPQPQENPPDVEMKAETENENQVAENGEVEMKVAPEEEPKLEPEQPKETEPKEAAQPQLVDNKEAPQADTRPEETTPETQAQENKPKKATKKRDKSKENKDSKKENEESMAVDEKESKMEVDAGASQ